MVVGVPARSRASSSSSSAFSRTSEKNYEPPPFLISLSNLPYHDIRIIRFTSEVKLIIEAEERTKFSTIPEVKKLRGTTYWNRHARWIYALETIYKMNHKFLKEITLCLTTLSHMTIEQLIVDSFFDQIEDYFKTSVFACYDNLAIYDKEIDRYKFKLDQNVFCADFKPEKYLTEEKLSRNTEVAATFLETHIEQIKVKFEKAVKDTLTAMEPLRKALYPQFAASFEVLEALDEAHIDHTKYSDIIEKTKWLADKVDHENGEHIMKEIEKFVNILKPVLVIQDNIPSMIRNCLDKGICTVNK